MGTSHSKKPVAHPSDQHNTCIDCRLEPFEASIRASAKAMPTIATLEQTYGKPKQISGKENRFYARSHEEDCWLMGNRGNNRRLFYQRIQWVHMTVFTYKCKNGDELIYKIIPFNNKT